MNYREARLTIRAFRSGSWAAFFFADVAIAFSRGVAECFATISAAEHEEKDAKGNYYPQCQIRADGVTPWNLGEMLF